MSSLIDTADQFRKVHSGPPRILLIDIERVPAKAYAFQRKIRGGFLALDNFIDRPETITFSAKWHGDKTAKFYAVWDQPDDPDYLAKKAWDLVDEADVVVTYFGTGADQKWLRNLWVQHRLYEPSPYIHVDMYYVVSKNLDLLSNSLGEVSRFLGLTGKNGKYNILEAIKCLEGDEKARKQMARYNKGDVGPQSLEGVFDIMRPYIKNLPLGHFGDGCINCGSTFLTLVPNKYKLTGAAAYEVYRCDDCHTLNRGKKSVNSPTMRSV